MNFNEIKNIDYKKKHYQKNNRPYEHPQRRKGSERKEKPPDRYSKKHIITPKCYECGGDHLRPECPRINKGKGKIQSLSEELKNLRIKEQEIIMAMNQYDTGDEYDAETDSSSELEIRQMNDESSSDSCLYRFKL